MSLVEPDLKPHLIDRYLATDPETERRFSAVSSEIRAEIQQLAEAQFEEARKAAAEAVCGALPIAYPFIVSNPGEAAQAKRRLAAVTIGVIVGSVSAYYGGMVDNVLMRIVDVLIILPSLMATLILAAVLTPMLGRTTLPAMIALIAFGWMGYARIIRGDILSVKERDYVMAARVIGAQDRRILFKHIIPNAIFPTLVLASLGIGDVVLAFAALSFLGIGTDLGYADWGQVLSFARNWMTSLNTYWYIIVYPGIALILFVMGWNLLGDALRDVLDPRLRGKV